MSCGELEVDKLYEPKQNKKIVRIFTVILYMFSVSLGAILLSLYYVFLWKNPHTQAVMKMDNSSLVIEPSFSTELISTERVQDNENPRSNVPKLPKSDIAVPTAFPKTARGVPPVASRLTDSRLSAYRGASTRRKLVKNQSSSRKEFKGADLSVHHI